MDKKEFLKEHDEKLKEWLLKASFILKYLPISWWEENIFWKTESARHSIFFVLKAQKDIEDLNYRIYLIRDDKILKEKFARIIWERWRARVWQTLNEIEVFAFFLKNFDRTQVQFEPQKYRCDMILNIDWINIYVEIYSPTNTEVKWEENGDMLSFDTNEIQTNRKILRDKVVNKIMKPQLPALEKNTRNLLVIVGIDQYFINHLWVSDFTEKELENISAVLFHDKNATTNFGDKANKRVKDIVSELIKWCMFYDF